MNTHPNPDHTSISHNSRPRQKLRLLRRGLLVPVMAAVLDNGDRDACQGATVHLSLTGAS